MSRGRFVRLALLRAVSRTEAEAARKSPGRANPAGTRKLSNPQPHEGRATCQMIHDPPSGT